MRKFILIAAMVLVSATAQAGGSRGLTMASNDPPAAAEQPKAVAPKTVEAPKYVARPAPVDTTTPAPQAGQAKPAADRTTAAPNPDKAKRKRGSIKARVIYALHRHGIYW